MTSIRRLAAIIAADVVGYSRLMGADEEGTLKRLVKIRQAVVDPAVGKSGGRIVKTTGDGFLIEFPSAVEAVRCSLEIQQHMAEHEKGHSAEQRFQFRIGINVGDVIASDDDIHGDGVNVAARLEALAEPGGILVSATVHATAANRLPCSFDDLGERSLKNIEKPVRVYRVTTPRETTERPALALPDKPSLAVLPFQNMSGDPEQEYFADGMVEDITTALSRISGLFVIARNSSFTYKGRAVDVRQVGRELGVRYVLEGSVRKAGNRVRITCQLIDAATGAHVWADRFDSNLHDIFELQDRVTESVAAAIEPSLQKAEIDRSMRKPTDRLDAYDLYFQAMFHYERRVSKDVAEARAGVGEALRLLRKAIELDPGFSLAKAMAAVVVVYGVTWGWTLPDTPDVTEAIGFARSAMVSSRDDPTTLCMAGAVLAFFAVDLDAARESVQRAKKLNPNSAQVLMVTGMVHLYSDEWGSGREDFERALRLSPLDPWKHVALYGLSLAVGEMGNIEQALDLMKQSIATGYGRSYMMIHFLVLLGRIDEAKKVAEQVRATDPGYTIAAASKRLVCYSTTYRERRIASMRAAGVPEN